MISMVLTDKGKQKPRHVSLQTNHFVDLSSASTGALTQVRWAQHVEMFTPSPIFHHRGWCGRSATSTWSMRHSIKGKIWKVLTRHADFDNSLVEGIAVFDEALIVSAVGGLQVEHVHCCPVLAVQLSVDQLLGCYFLRRMKPIDKFFPIFLTFFLKVEEFDGSGVVRRAANGQISANFPPKVNVPTSSSVWKKTQGANKVRGGWKDGAQSRVRSTTFKKGWLYQQKNPKLWRGCLNYS